MSDGPVTNTVVPRTQLPALYGVNAAADGNANDISARDLLDRLRYNASGSERVARLLYDISLLEGGEEKVTQLLAEMRRLAAQGGVDSPRIDALENKYKALRETADDPGAVPDVGSNDLTAILKILDTLEKAQRKLLEIVMAKIKENTDLTAEQQTALKLKYEQRLQAQLARIKKLLRAAEHLPPTQARALRAAAEQIQIEINGLATSAEGLTAENYGAQLTALEAKLDKIDETLTRLEGQQRNCFDERNMVVLFGYNWITYVTNPEEALADGHLSYNELTAAGQARVGEGDGGLGLTPVIGNADNPGELTEEEIADYVEAKRRLAANLGINLDQVMIGDSRVTKLLGELCRAANSPGGLTRAKLNEILLRYEFEGVRFNNDSFAYIIAGMTNRFGVTETANYNQLLNGIDSWYLSVMSSLRLGTPLNLEELSADPEEAAEQIMSQRLEQVRDQAILFARGKKFYFVNAESRRQINSDLLFNIYCLNQRARLTPAQQLEVDAIGQSSGRERQERIYKLLLEISADLPPWLKLGLENIDELGLSVEHRWDEIELIIEGRIYGKIKTDAHHRTAEEMQLDRARKFERLMIALNSGDPSVVGEYQAALGRMLNSGETGEINVRNILKKKTVSAVPLGQP